MALYETPQAALEAYVEGSRAMDVALLRTCFHPFAVMNGYLMGKQLLGGPEPFFQDVEKAFRAALSAFDEGGDLLVVIVPGQCAVLESRCGLAQCVGDGEQSLELGAPTPHFDQGLLERGLAEERRVGLQRLEIAADGDRFADAGAVVEHEVGDHALRVDSAERFAELRTLA